MPKNLPIKTPVSNQRKLVDLRVKIHPLTREVSGEFQFLEVTEFDDGSHEFKGAGIATATEAQLAQFLTDEMWGAVSQLAHGLADEQLP